STLHCQTRRRGFTLIELLVATSILTLVVVLVSSLTHSATTTITSNTHRLDGDSQAREFLNRLERDFDSMLIRPDIDYTTFKNALYPDTGTTTQIDSNDWFAFYAENQGYFPGTINTNDISPYAVIGYDGTNDDKINKGPVIQRLSKGLGWQANSNTWRNIRFNKNLRDNFAPPSYKLFSTTASDYPAFQQGTSKDPDFKTVGDQIFRFEYMYLLKRVVLDDGTVLEPELSIVPFHIHPKPAPGDAPLPDAIRGIHAFRDVDAIVVAIAVLDTKSREMQEQKGFVKLVSSLPDMTEAAIAQGDDIESLWTSKLIHESFPENSGLIETVAANIRIYQRYYYLNKK
ncbi:MAG TPA: type II secretion system protein, partial [Chthoniobacteraceae bacterium]|nr:type II secretion system protein [Chthoniobacteraceae bacterium]